MRSVRSMPPEAPRAQDGGSGRGRTHEPTLAGAFADDGVDLTLIRWMLRQSPTERLRFAQALVDAAWTLRKQE